MSKFDKIKKTLQETPLLNRYLKSRGINPDFATKDQKVAHSKTAQFKTWMMHHINDNVTESVDKRDTITMDIPLLIRVLEFAREDLKSDVDLHKMVERLIAIRGKGTLTMNQYGKIIREEFSHLSEERIDEISKELANSYMWQAKSDRDKIDNRRMKLHDKNSQQMRYSGSISLRRHKNITKLLAKSGKRTDGINRALDRLAKEETELDESWKYHTYSSNEAAHAAVKTHHAFRDDKGMSSGNPARVMGNGKVAYKGEFKGPKPTKSVSEAKEANYGGDYQSTVLRVKELAKKKPVDMKSLAARMQASYAKDEKKPVKEDISRRGVLKGILGVGAAGAASKAHSIAGAFPSPSTRAKWAKDAEESNRNEAKRQAEKKKKELEDNTKEVERQQKINHHSLANEEVNKKSIIGKIVRGHQLKKKVDSSFEKIGAAQKQGDSAGASKAFRDHERYANLERPGTWTKVKEETVTEGYWVHRDDDTKLHFNTVAQLRQSKVAKSNHKVTDHKHKNLGTVADVLRNQTLYKTEEVLDEGNGYDDNRTGFAKKPREDDEGYGKPKFKAKSTMDRPHTVHIDGKPWKKFSNGHQAQAAVNTLTAKGKKATAIAHFKESLEPMAACNQPGDGANNPDDTVKSTSKKVKLLLGAKKKVTEEMYDHEKEDKPSAGLKRPKVLKLAMDSTKEAPQAAAVLQGGKTLTGSSRDTIEIDPMMQTKKSQKSV